MIDLSRKIDPEVKSLKTRAGAQARLDRVRDAYFGDEHVLVAVIEANGGYVPVAILNEKNMWMARTLVDCGVCVTSA